MENIVLKLISIFVIFLLTLLGGLLPFLSVYRKEEAKFFICGQHFARGIFLGTALLHIFPEAMLGFYRLYPEIDYPVIALILVTTLVLLNLIEYIVLYFFRRSVSETQHFTVYLLIIFLSVHSIIEGAALGVGATVAEILIILIAILAHKGSAAFALVIKMQQYTLSKKFVLKILLLFACMTPLGILAGSVIENFQRGQGGQLTLSIINAITAGTFLFIACFEQEQLSRIISQH